MTSNGKSVCNNRPIRKEALSRQQAELDARQHELETHVVQIKDKQSKTIALETDLSALRSQRALLLEGRPTYEVENQNRRRQEELQQHWDIVMRQYQDLSGALESYKGQSVQLEKEVERLEVLSQEENRRITEWLSGREEITTRAELEELLSKDIVWINREKKELTALKERFTTVQAVLAERVNCWLNTEKVRINRRKEKLKSLCCLNCLLVSHQKNSKPHV